MDVGCGAGRVGLYLQEKGFDVTGIDNSPMAVAVCKKRGLKKARVMSISEVGRFASASFDTVVLFGNNFGLFGSAKNALSLLKKLYRITGGNARMIAESRDPYGTDDPVHLAYHKSNLRRGRMAGQLRIRIRFRNFVGNWFDYLLVSKEEMREILAGTGWKVDKFINGGESTYVAILKKRGAMPEELRTRESHKPDL